MPYLSILLGTLRAGGLDVVFESLENQPYRDFEVVLVDGIYKYRKQFVEEKFKKYSFPIKYAEPIDNPFPIDAICRYRNTELLLASGEIVLFASDYTFYTKDLLTNHANFHKENKNAGLTCPHLFKQLPKLNENFKGYTYNLDMSKNEISQYCADLEAGKLDSMMWSIFETPVDGNYVIPSEPDPWKDNSFDPKLRASSGPTHPSCVWTINDSCPRAAALSIGGFNEYLDGAHGWNDTEFAERLTVRAGVTWHCDPKNIAYIINPRSVSPYALHLRELHTNQEIYNITRSRAYGDKPKSIIEDVKFLVNNGAISLYG